MVTPNMVENQIERDQLEWSTELRSGTTAGLLSVDSVDWIRMTELELEIGFHSIQLEHWRQKQ
jgi:hypothetical protein